MRKGIVLKYSIYCECFVYWQYASTDVNLNKKYVMQFYIEYTAMEVGGYRKGTNHKIFIYFFKKINYDFRLSKFNIGKD